MTLVRWAPFSRFPRFHELEDSTSRGPVQTADFVRPLRIDLYDEGEKLIVKAPLPGANPEQVRLHIENGILTIEADLSEQKEEKDGDTNGHRWYYREMWTGKVGRQLRLPTTVDADKVEASFTNGMLTLTLPKTSAARGRQIPVKAA